MNRDILILREAINKVVQMLAGMGLKVTQRGSSAYVQTNPKTLKPELVNIPFIPDNASDELIHAIQGFMDHEVAHILFTDWTAVVEAAKTPKLDSLHNIVEDPFIEREMGKKFPGAAHNIHVLHDFFIAKITQPALDEIDAAQRAGKLKGEDYELARFSVLLVPLVRAWSGQFSFHDFMSKNGHYTANKFISLLVAKTPQPVIDRIPRIKDSWEALDVAKELHAILYPPKQQPQEANQPGDGEPCEDGQDGKPSKDNKSNKKDTPGKGEKEHKNESKNADGDEDSNENPEDANNEAGEGEGEAGSNEGGTTKSAKGDKSKKNKEKKEDAEKADDEAQDDDPGSDSAREDGEGADGNEGDEPGSDRDPSDEGEGEEGDGSEDDADGDRGDDLGAGDRGSGPDDDEADGEPDGDDAGDAGAADGDADDEDQQDGDGDDAGRGGDQDEDASEAEEGEEGSSGEADGDEDEGEGADGQEGGDAEEGSEDGKGTSELTEGEADEDIDIDDANNHQKADGEDMKASGQPGIGHVDGDFEDVEVKPFSFEAMVRQHITDEAVRQTRGADYAIYSNEFDILSKHEMTPSFQAAQFTGLEDTTRGMVGVMQKEIERMMAQRNRVFNVGGQKSGKLNAPGFSRILVNDPRVFKRKQEHQAKDTAVSLLVDNSGSMSGQRLLTAMTAAYALSSTLDRVNIQHECLGFTTAYQGKPGSGYDFYKIESESRRLGVEYSRIVPLRITIFKDFAERLTPPVRHRFADMAFNQPNLMSNIDGEAVQIALNRLQTRKEQRKVLLVLSDGMPAGGVSTDLYSHLHKVVADAEKAKIEVIGIGIQTDAVKSFYPKHAVLNNVNDLPKMVMGELKKILLAA